MKITLSKSMPITDHVPGLGTVSIVWEGGHAVRLCIEEEPPEGITVRQCLEHYVNEQELALKQVKRELGYFKEMLEALPNE
jgi:hypothetical protein